MVGVYRFSASRLDKREIIHLFISMIHQKAVVAIQPSCLIVVFLIRLSTLQKVCLAHILAIARIRLTELV